MMRLNRYTFFVALLAGTLLSGVVRGQQQAIQTVQTAQVEVQEGTNAFVESLTPIFEELSELGASEDDLSLIRETLGELTQLSGAEMTAIIAALDVVLNNPGTEGVDANLEAALAGQGKVVQSLHEIFQRLRVRQLELSVASKAENLRRRQAENQHLTEMLEAKQGDHVIAEAEQKALEESVSELAREMESIQKSAQQERAAEARAQQDAAQPESAAAKAAAEEKLNKMKELAKQATDQVEQKEYAEAAETQKKIGEMLADLAAEAGVEPTSEEFVEDLVRQLRHLLERQTTLMQAGAQGDASAEESLAIATEALRIPAENINAPAGFQVQGAAKAMRSALFALASAPAKSPAADQAVAIQSLQKAIELLEQNLDKMKDKQDASESEELEALADMYRKSENLKRRQSQQNNGEAKDEQAQIARETAALQADVLASSPEAARSLGRAAVRMAEALNPALEEAERNEMLGEASQQLSSATESILLEGRARRSQSVAQGRVHRSGEEVDLEDDILGVSTLNPADRAAIESARREPVSSEYVPLVEAYFDKLSRSSGQSR